MDSLGSSLESLLEGLEPVPAGPRLSPAKADPGALLDLRAAAPSPRGAFEFNWQVEGPRARGRAAKASSAALKPKPVDPLDSLGSLADPGSGAASPSDLSAFSWKALPPAHPKKPGGAPGKTPLERLFDPPLTAVPEA